MRESMKVIEIDSLAKFIYEIVKYKECFFRGESKDFEEKKNMASGFRWMIDHKKTFREMKSLRNDYHQEIGYSLSKKDEENFIAYCQHHGLPTELIDITENPLVALYFSCEENWEDMGYVYAFSESLFNEIPDDKKLKDKVVSEQSFNIMDYISVPTSFGNSGSDTDFLNQEIDSLYKTHYYSTYDGNVIPDGEGHIINDVIDEVLKQYKYLFEKNPKFYEEAGPLFYGIDSETGEDFIPYLEQKKDIVEMFKDATDLDLRNPLNRSKLKSFKEYTAILDKASNLSEYFEIENKYTWSIYDIVWDLFAELVDKQSTWGITVDLTIFPYYIYKPSVKFDRMVNQQGIFIIQQYFNDRPQELIPNVVFKINNKKEILQELDRIGISKKFIYPDHDHIAQYVKEKKNYDMQ